jgi:hypothetical protein
MYHETRSVMQKYRAPDDGTGDPGAAAPEFKPEEARTWLSSVIPDPDYVKALPDDKLKTVYTGTQEAWKKANPYGDDPWRGIATEYATKDGQVDEKVLARVKRYATPADALNAQFALQSRISAGEFRSVLPKDANDEQIKAWRAENGIPEAPDKYELKLKDGLVVGDEDKSVIDAFLKSAHGANLNASQASAAVDWYYEEIERQTAARADQDKALAAKAQDALRAAWGTDYRTNENLVMGLLDSAPAGVKDQFMHGRLADGTPIMSHPETVMWLRQLSGEINPVTALIPNAGANTMGAVEDEIKQIETWMKAPRTSPEGKKYWGDEKVQTRYRALLDARDKQGKK